MPEASVERSIMLRERCEYNPGRRADGLATAVTADGDEGSTGIAITAAPKSAVDSPGIALDVPDPAEGVSGLEERDRACSSAG